MYFNPRPATVEDAKMMYRLLAKQYHPDLGGSTEAMQAVNNEYEALLRSYHGQKSSSSDGKAHTYYYNAERERAAMDTIYDLLSKRMQGVEIALIGSWIWVTGNTRANVAQIKAVDGMHWHDKRKCWYWKPEDAGRSRYSRASLAELAMKYGVRDFAQQDETTVQAAGG